MCRVLDEPCILSYSFSLNGDKSVTVFATISFKTSCLSTSGPEVDKQLVLKDLVAKTVTLLSPFSENCNVRCRVLPKRGSYINMETVDTLLFCISLTQILP